MYIISSMLSRCVGCCMNFMTRNLSVLLFSSHERNIYAQIFVICYKKLVRLLIISIDINVFGYYCAMKEKMDCKLLHEAHSCSLQSVFFSFIAR